MMTGKESQQKKLKPLNVKQSSSESASHSKMDPINDLKMKQTGSWISRQESKRSRDFMKFSQTKLGKKKNELSTHEKQESIATFENTLEKKQKKNKQEIYKKILKNYYCFVIYSRIF